MWLGPCPHTSYLVPVALQLQPLGSCLKVPDPNGEVIGRGGQHIGGQGVEAQRVDLLCVALRRGMGEC